MSLILIQFVVKKEKSQDPNDQLFRTSYDKNIGYFITISEMVKVRLARIIVQMGITRNLIQI